MNEPRFAECRLFSWAGDGIQRNAGRTTRELVVMPVKGRALLGPAVFPVQRPQIHPGERLRFTKAGGWYIVGAKPR